MLPDHPCADVENVERDKALHFACACLQQVGLERQSFGLCFAPGAIDAKVRQVQRKLGTVPVTGKTKMAKTGSTSRRTAAASQPTPRRGTVSAADEKKAADLLKLAREMQENGLDKGNVSRILQQILQKYPNSRAAKEAKRILAGLK